MANEYIIWVDGASSGRMTGPAAAAYHAEMNAKFLAEGGLYLDGSNNQAEILAIYLGMRFFCEKSQPDDTLIVIGDSQWAMYCLAKKIKYPHMPHWETSIYPEIFQDIVKLWDEKRMKLRWVPRESNKKADKLSKAIKKRGY